MPRLNANWGGNAGIKTANGKNPNEKNFNAASDLKSKARFRLLKSRTPTAAQITVVEPKLRRNSTGDLRKFLAKDRIPLQQFPDLKRNKCDKDGKEDAGLRQKVAKEENEERKEEKKKEQEEEKEKKRTSVAPATAMRPWTSCLKAMTHSPSRLCNPLFSLPSSLRFSRHLPGRASFPTPCRSRFFGGPIREGQAEEEKEEKGGRSSVMTREGKGSMEMGLLRGGVCFTATPILTTIPTHTPILIPTTTPISTPIPTTT
eukprot:CAMPEP_0175058676 /NCGR_PEP_ID=MMETSP0052_2-20121109/11986_1 /TAXON_ID=51329 ORGANISM="Polytomella parva, Strain SAG 63-3" /NCGR_SAMPLE_ID=MMETSP0052_2 /ASSEMBLY_ACC=CAM_ASM_000194 /LENGTH=258 /DNA_ID=CAMNT_0016324095 /DNA_START=1 /DNA_END=774 /DNA_ORIENTATION=-